MLKPRRHLELLPYQHTGVDFITEHRRGNLFAGMGMGKTIAALMASDCISLLEQQRPTLILGPLRVARDTWPDEAHKWDAFKHIEIQPITGDKRQRLAALNKDRQFFSTNYEQLPWLVHEWMERWPYANVIADESTRLKNFRTKQGGMRAHSLARVAHTLVKRWVNLTGTPVPNGLKDLWGQMWYIDKGARLGTTYTAYMERWFGRGYDGVVRPFPHAHKEITNLIKDVSLTLDPKDYFDLREPIVRQIRVKLPDEARKLYDEMENEMFIKLQDMTEIEALNSLSLTSKLQQLANGAIYAPAPNWKQVHDAKLEALESIESEANGMPLLVAYQFKSDLERIRKAFPKSVLLSEPKGMAAFKAGDSPMGLAHPASMGHGIDGLQEITNILVRFGHDWNHEHRAQMLERIGPMRQLQSKMDRNVFVFDIVAEDTIDLDVIESHEAKRSAQEQLLLACKRRKDAHTDELAA